MTTYLSDRRTGGTDPAGVVSVTLPGSSRNFQAGRRTAAHLQWTAAQIGSGRCLYIIQGPYNTGVAASAGTHDGDGVVDVSASGLSWDELERFMRECGWAAWHRTPEQGFSHHVHAVSLGCPGPVGIYVPGQVADYYAHRTGLAGHASDPTWHPADIDSTVFDYPAYEETTDMTPQQAAQLDAITKAIPGIVDMLEALAASDEQVKARITKSKREVLAAMKEGQS